MDKMTDLDFRAIYTIFVAEHAGGALLIFPVTWLMMRKKAIGQVSSWWLLLGLLATAFITRSVRFLSIFVIGGKKPKGLLTVFFFVGVPIVVAIGVCSFIRTRAKSAEQPKPNKIAQEVVTHYDVFSLTEDAPAEAIRAAYTSLIQTHHFANAGEF
jgi:hypothetical protein